MLERYKCLLCFANLRYVSRKARQAIRGANDDGITCDQFLIKRDLKIHQSSEKRIKAVVQSESKSTLV